MLAIAGVNAPVKAGIDKDYRNYMFFMQNMSQVARFADKDIIDLEKIMEMHMVSFFKKISDLERQ